jgi:hypothetical protein
LRGTWTECGASFVISAITAFDSLRCDPGEYRGRNLPIVPVQAFQSALASLRDANVGGEQPLIVLSASRRFLLLIA